MARVGVAAIAALASVLSWCWPRGDTASDSKIHVARSTSQPLRSLVPLTAVNKSTVSNAQAVTDGGFGRIGKTVVGDSKMLGAVFTGHLLKPDGSLDSDLQALLHLNAYQCQAIEEMSRELIDRLTKCRTVEEIETLTEDDIRTFAVYGDTLQAKNLFQQFEAGCKQVLNPDQSRFLESLAEQQFSFLSLSSGQYDSIVTVTPVESPSSGEGYTRYRITNVRVFSDSADFNYENLSEAEFTARYSYLFKSDPGASGGG